MTKIDEMMTLVDMDFTNQDKYRKYMKARSAVYNAQKYIDHINTNNGKIRDKNITKWNIISNLAKALLELSNRKTYNMSKAYDIGEQLIKEYIEYD